MRLFIRVRGTFVLLTNTLVDVFLFVPVAVFIPRILGLSYAPEFKTHFRNPCLTCYEDSYCL
jgi:hypothetical protein